MNTPTKSKCDRTPTILKCDRTPTPITDTLFNEIEPEFCDMSAWDYFCEMTVLATEHETKLSAVTEQRDSLHKLHNKNAARSKELLEFYGMLRKELTAVTEQRNEARKLAERYRYLSCDSQEEADATLLPWENNQPTEP